MGIFSIRTAGLAAIAALAVSSFGATDSLADKITPGSVEGQNITAATDFIKSMGPGMDKVADAIQKALKDGDLYRDDLSGGDAAKTSIIDNTTIDNQRVGVIDGRKVAFDPKNDFGKIFYLALILYHESVHRNQNWELKTASSFGKNAAEYQAWTKTLLTTYGWIRRLWAEYKKTSADDKDAKRTAAQKLDSATAIWSAEAAAFIEEHKAFGYDQEPWKKLAKSANDLKGAAKQLGFAELQDKDRTTPISDIEKLIDTDLPTAVDEIHGIREKPRTPTSSTPSSSKKPKRQPSPTSGERKRIARSGGSLRPAGPEVTSVSVPGGFSAAAWTASLGAGALYTWSNISVSTPVSDRTIHAPGPAFNLYGQIGTPIGLRLYGDILFGEVQGGSFDEIFAGIGNSGSVGGTFNSMYFGASYDVVRSSQYYAGPYVGYYYGDQTLVGRTASAPDSEFPLLHAIWQAPLVGVAGAIQLTERVAVNAIVASMPKVYATWGAFRGNGTGWLANGTASYQVTPQFSLDLHLKWRTENVSDNVGAPPIHVDSTITSLGIGVGVHGRW